MTRIRRAAALAALALIVLPLAARSPAANLPPGFFEEIVWSGLRSPTAVRFAPDGRVFVAEKSGIVKAFDGLDDPTPDVVADLRTNVHSYWDRGLLGLALDPGFPAVPYVYVLYTYNALPGGTAPQWPPAANGFDDNCPTPPGPTADGCVVTGRLSRLEIDASNRQLGPELPLIENQWCQQFPSHTVGDLAFDSTGALYVSAGDGANFLSRDWGQFGGTLPDPMTPLVPLNPCGDPGGASPPAAEGGALRAQDLFTPGDPVSFDGTVLRVDPASGNALPTNPLWGGAVADDDRIVAYGLRNPFRIAVRPGTNEIWVGDVGWDLWEEIDRIADPTALTVPNFGWPCYEGERRQGSYDAANLTLCETLYLGGGHVKPYFTYPHGSQPGDPACQGASSSIAGLAFYPDGTYPSAYRDALFFADYSRRCIWTMFAGAGGLPDPATVQTFASAVNDPVALQVGPGGDLFYVDLNGGTVRRIRYTPANNPPTAVATANVTSGPSPLTVHLDGSTSSDPDPGDALSFAWDLDGDGAFDDSTEAAPTFTYTAGSYVVSLRVTDLGGATNVATLSINVANAPPHAVIDSPDDSLTWSVGDPIEFAGSASDPDEGTLPPESLRWQIIMHHCPSFDCHTHVIEELSGVAGSVFLAPDHEYPSFLEIRLTATDAGGLEDVASVELQPNVVTLGFESTPPGLALALGSEVATTPFERTLIVGSTSSMSAPSPQDLDGTAYELVAWSDGSEATHQILATADPATYGATYRPLCGNGALDPDEDCDGGDCCSAHCTFEPPTAVCRPSAGACDVAETCSGTSAGCPADAKRTSVCRASAGACDPAESCDGIGADCPADARLPDTDHDGVCDTLDPCTAGTAIGSGVLVLRDLGGKPGDDHLSFEGAFNVPTPVNPTLDPVAQGIRILVADSIGNTVFDARVPGGYDPATGNGWTANKPRTRWLYLNTSGPAGVSRITLHLGPASGRVEFTVAAKGGTYLPNARLPLRATISLNPNRQCGEVGFPPAACVPRLAGKTVRCG